MTGENSNDRSTASASSTNPPSADDSNLTSATLSVSSSSSSPRVDEDNNTSSGLGDESSPSVLLTELEPSTDGAASVPPEATSSPSAGQAPNSDSVCFYIYNIFITCSVNC